MADNGYGLNLTREMSYPTPVANSALLLPLLMSLMTDPRTPRTRDTFQPEYDYVVVGGGTGGSALASRLSEDPSVSVLLLEAGIHSPVLTEVPGFDGVWWHSDIDWQFYTTPQKNAGFAIVDHKLPFPCGKGLGGTSIINGQLYVRGNRHNFDMWAEMGATGWSYEEVLPYFKKSENNTDSDYLATRYHNGGGLLQVGRPNFESKVKAPIFSAAEELGYKVVDINGERQTGFTDVQRTMRNQQRLSSAKAFLVPAENRTNLDILVGAFATQVLIEKSNLIAEGVVFEHDGESHQVMARKEVILSAGAFQSPKLLMLSGIGPKAELEKHGIDVLVDLPVGKNLMEHPASLMNYQIDPNITTFGTLLGQPENIQDYIDNRAGPLTATADMAVVAFLKGNETDPTEDFPNYELYFTEASVAGYTAVFKFSQEVYDAYYKPYETQPILNCNPQLVQPKSRGTVTLNSKDPHDPPLIDPNLFDHPQDLQDTVDGLKTCHKLARSESLKKIGVKMFDLKFPGCEDVFEDEDKYLTCFAQHVVVTTSHHSGTAKMGNPNDPTTVVDPRLRVKGVKNLRVVDASIMPIVTSGNTMTPVYMIAEKAADMIKEDAAM